MSALRIMLLGTFEVMHGRGTVVRLPTKKAQALLASLAMPVGRQVGRDETAALLWSDVPRPSARNNLRQTLFVLRKALGRATAALELDAIAMRLADDVVVDVAEFERDIASKEPEVLSAAIARYRGDFLAGLRVDEPAFEAWLLAHRTRLRALMLDGLTRLVEHDAFEGNVGRALDAARRGLALDPRDESMHRAMMRLHAAAGRPGAALRQYQVCVDTLQRELGVEPVAETRALYRAVLAQRQSAAREPATSAVPWDTPLVGRDAERARLADALDECARGHGRLIGIVGEAGIGKSRLVRELATDAERHGARVVVARSHDAAPTPSLHPWVEAVRSGDLAAGVDVTRWPAGWRSEILRMFPEIDAAASPDPVREDSALHRFEALGRLLIGAATTRPLVIILEDLHWADTLSVRFLAFLAHRIGDVPILVAVTTRDDDADASVLRVLAELERESRLVRVRLGPLAREGTDRLVRIHARAAVVNEPLATLQELVWASSGGNPFVVVEMVQAFQSAEPVPPALPRKVHELIADRLARLGEHAQELAALAAVMTVDIDFALLARASGLDDGAAAEGLEELVRRRVLHGVDDRFAFVHDRVRDVALDRVPPERRTRLHRRLAEAAEALYAQGVEGLAAILARHYRAAEMWEQALPHLRRMGLDALTAGAQREAARCFEQAIDALDHLPETAEHRQAAIDVRIEIRHALVPIGAFDEIGPHLFEAARRARELGDQPRLGRVLAFIGNYHINRCEYGEAREALAAAQAIAQNLDDPTLEATLLMFLGMMCHQTGDYAAGVGHYRRFIGDANEGVVRERVGVSGLTLVYARAYLCICLAELGEFSEGYAVAEQTIRLADALRHPWALAHASLAMSCLATRQGHPERALATYAWYRGLLRPTGEVWTLADAFAAHAESLAGRPADALTRLDPDSSPPSIVPPVRLWRASACFDLGRMLEAQAIVGDVLAVARGRGEDSYAGWALVMLGEVASRMAPRRAGDAEARYMEALAIAQRRGMRPLEAHCRLGLARVYERAGRREDASQEMHAARVLLTALGMTRWLPPPPGSPS